MLIERGICSLFTVSPTSFPIQIFTTCAKAVAAFSHLSFLAETGPGGALQCGTSEHAASSAVLTRKRCRAQHYLRLAAGSLLLLGSLGCFFASAQTARFSYRRTVGSGFNNPWGVAVNGRGDVFVADTGNYAVKEIVAIDGAVSASSTVITLHGFGAPWGLAVDGSGDVFVTGALFPGVEEIVAVNGVVSSSSSVVPVGSGFMQLQGLAVDGSGNLFITDPYNKVVEEIVAFNGVVSSSSSVIPVGSGFLYPDGIAVDRSGNLFVADNYSNTVNEVVAVNGAVSGSSAVIPVGSGFNQPWPWRWTTSERLCYRWLPICSERNRCGQRYGVRQQRGYFNSQRLRLA